jgi:serine/threonine protein kinase
VLKAMKDYQEDPEGAAEIEIMDIIERNREATRSPPIEKTNDRYQENKRRGKRKGVPDEEEESSEEEEVVQRFRPNKLRDEEPTQRPLIPTGYKQAKRSYHSKKVILYESNRDEDGYHSDSCDSEERMDQFTFGRELGQGAYAVVKHAVHDDTGEEFAVKIYDKTQLTDINRQRSVRREIKLLERMNHQHIAQIYEAFETDSHVYLVMEYVSGGSLHGYLKSHPNRQLPEEEARRIFQQMMFALQYCHRKCITHRDIKLENVLLDENKNVKLIDFGFSTCIPNDKKIKIFCGTPSYMAPEIVKKTEYAGPPADIWATAVLLYALMNGCFPYRGATDAELYRKICRGTYAMPNTNVTRKFEKLLMKLFNCNADMRPSADSVLEEFWVTGKEAPLHAPKAPEVAKPSQPQKKLNQEAYQAYYNTTATNNRDNESYGSPN